MRWVPNFHLSLRVSLPLTIAVLLALPLAGWGQQELRSGKKGVTVPAPVTSTSIDADTQALDVAIKAGSITLSGADGAILDGVTPAVKATVFDRTNSNPIAVQTVDSNGDPVSAGGGTQYTEDAASAADPVGTQTICRRRDTPATETTTDGDNTAANCTGKGELYVKHIDPIAVTQSGVWTVQQGTPPWAMKPDGTVWTLTGTSANVAVTNSVAVTGTFWQATQPISALSLPLPTGASTLAEQQTQTTALQLIDNLPLAQSAATAGQSGVLAMGAVTTAAPTYTTGNTNPISLQTDGSQRVAITNTPTVTANAGSGTFNIQANASVNVSQYNGSAVGAANAIHVQPGTGANFATTEQSAAAILAGQQSVTASAVALATNTTKEVCVKALLANTINVYVGPSGVTTSTGLELGPGDSYCTRVTNTNALFVIASTTGAGVSWAARN